MILYNIAKAKEVNRKGPKMKAKELISQIKQSEKDTDNFYATHLGYSRGGSESHKQVR